MEGMSTWHVLVFNSIFGITHISFEYVQYTMSLRNRISYALPERCNKPHFIPLPLSFTQSLRKYI